MSVAQGCGLGGGSLINANVALDAEPGVFEDPLWPEEIKQYFKKNNDLYKVDQDHVVKMLNPPLTKIIIQNWIKSIA